MSLLQAENLTKIYGSGSTAVAALSRVNLSVESGEFVAVMGPSGCGKSTLLHLLGGLDTPSEGRVLLDGAQKDAETRARAWLARVGLQDRLSNRPSDLSGGEQQRVALARALVTEPAIILADEPTGNLDSRSADEMLQLLHKSSDEWGRTVVLVTHDPRMAAYADRILFMKDGTIVDDTRLSSNHRADEILKRLGVGH